MAREPSPAKDNVHSKFARTKSVDWRLSNTALDFCAEPCNNYAVHLDEFGGVVPLAEVRLQEGESLENALRRFKRKVQQEDIIKEVKRHSFYLKPGEKKRVKEALARKRSRKKARKEQD